MTDAYDPPGIITARGSNISIDSEGVLYFQHGARVVRLLFGTEQWGLLARALDREAWRVLIEVDYRRSLHLERSKKAEGSYLITAKSPTGHLRIMLSRNETDDLKEAARRRANQPSREEV